LAAAYIENLASQLFSLGAERVALIGGLAQSIEPSLSEEVAHRLVPPKADALTGAVELARAAACAEIGHEW
jgi:glucosamine kinase